MAVYFIRAGADGPWVKIGHAANPQWRLRQLDTTSPFPLVIMRLVDGGRSVERWLHRYFSDLRMHKEWFRFSPEMLTIVPPHLVDPLVSQHPEIDRLIAKFGTQTKLAEAIGARQSAIAAWKKRGFIPSRQQERILDAARELGIELEPWELIVRERVA